MDFAKTGLPYEAPVTDAFSLLSRLGMPARLEEAVASTRVLQDKLRNPAADVLAGHLISYGLPRMIPGGAYLGDYLWAVDKYRHGSATAMAETIHGARADFDNIHDSPVIHASESWLVRVSNLAVGIVRLQVGTGSLSPDDLQEEIDAYRKTFQFLGSTNEALLEECWRETLSAAQNKLRTVPTLVPPAAPVFNTAADPAPAPKPQIDWDVYTHVHPLIRRQQGISVFKK